MVMKRIEIYKDCLKKVGINNWIQFKMCKNRVLLTHSYTDKLIILEGLVINNNHLKYI